MKTLIYYKRFLTGLLFIILLLIIPSKIINAQQKMSFGIHADPVINWFSSDIKQVRNIGSRPGFNFGLSYNKYFSNNYSFSTGISLLSTSGRLASSDTTIMDLSNVKTKVLPGSPVTYKIQYLTFPVGLKLETNQIGYVTFFSELGFVPKLALNRKLDIPSLSLSGENGSDEIRMFNLSYHITAGVEYSLGGTTALIFGLDFDNNFLDITKDPGNQPADKISQKIFSFRFGVNF